ncbi:ribosomal protein S18-alanine N-acetyltransferase [Thermogladius sp. 4427co]|uniref:ribosomal protein S18-alanine N-acetyltransferase n=1 Tax=Thermogladius sp. 4427co TaxID=3450718 RepID=UPI003F7A5E28
MKIRFFEQRDLDTILEIEKECFPPEKAYDKYVFEQIASLPGNIFIVAEISGKVVGYAAGFIEDRIGHIVSIAVKPAWQNRGIGSMLLDSLERLLKSRGAVCIYLEVAVNNRKALNLYLKKGYRIISLLEKYYGSVDGYLMEKCLPQE